MGEIVARKTVYALFPMDAQSIALAAYAGGGEPPPTEFMVRGTATLYEKNLDFEPGWLSRTLNKGRDFNEVLLHDISEVKVRFSFSLFRNVIDIVMPDGVFSMACFGVNDFAKKIREQRKKSG